MKKKNKYCLIFLLLFFLAPFFTSKSFSNENLNFLSLKNTEVNLRQGPSFEYPIKLIYKKKYLPVIILDKSETWRKIKDLENNSGWIHISQLSKKKSAINIKKNSIIFKKPTIFSKPVAKVEAGRLVLIKKCKILLWDQIGSGTVEAFACEIPSIIFWKRIYSQEAVWAHSQIKNLENVGIIHTDTTSLIKEIKKFQINPLNWMNNEKRKKAIVDFNNNYANYNFDKFSLLEPCKSNN